MITLRAGDWVAELAPEQGGAVRSLTRRGEAILRPSSTNVSDPLETACFPLVPHANRIADGRFSFRGREVRLPALPRFAPHALHGEGWRAAWAVEDQNDQCVTMSFAGGGGDWPWTYLALQTATLSGEGLRIDLTMTNTADEPAPAGLGLHPYFATTGDSALRLSAATVWLPDEREIPFRQAAPSRVADWSDGLPLAEAPFVDHCYGGWNGVARLETRSLAVEMRASANAALAQVYAPPGERYVCVEPVTHRPDAVNAPPGEASGVVVLAPGETLSIWMTIGLA